MSFETVIGLEVHVQLSTQSKLFSGAPTAYGAPPNTQACGIDLALPGVLPVLNEEALRMAIRFGLAVQADIAPVTVFARKNYFYPDLPKGYQISQFDKPIVQNGHLDLILGDGSQKRVQIVRAHLEEDAGKSLHEDLQGFSGLDFNRAGVPLLEIVTAPDLRSSAEAVVYLKTLHALVKYLMISDGNMQEGSFRCDANVSVRPLGDRVLGTRTEIKNLNSFRFVERAIEFEVKRQIALVESGQPIVQETRLFDAENQETRTLRVKEDAQDYRYFPEPDLLPVYVTTETIEAIRADLPELPDQKKSRFIHQYGLTAYDAGCLASERGLAEYFESVLQTSIQPKLAANWVMGEVSAALNKAHLSIEHCPFEPKRLASLLARIQDQTISGKIAKQLFQQLWAEPLEDVDRLIADQGLIQVQDPSRIDKVIQNVMTANPEQVLAYRQGKDKLFAFFVGQVMKQMQGQANPQLVNERLLVFLID